jgi:hypothetical protein
MISTFLFYLLIALIYSSHLMLGCMGLSSGFMLEKWIGILEQE